MAIGLVSLLAIVTFSILPNQLLGSVLRRKACFFSFYKRRLLFKNQLEKQSRHPWLAQSFHIKPIDWRLELQLHLQKALAFLLVQPLNMRNIIKLGNEAMG